MQDVVVVLPGITGSVLRRDGRDVWNPSAGAVVNALTSLGGSVRRLALADDPPDVEDLGDGVEVGGVIQDAHLIPGLWSIDGYTAVGRTLSDAFGLRPGRDLFEFGYDWRRDNRVAARRLARLSTGWLEQRRADGAADPKLILVAHSMGGLVSRYFLECLGGWRDTRRLVTFGTPYRGSLNALRFLANGFHLGWGPLSLDLSALLRSFTSVYQLLPIYPCCDPGTGTLARVDAIDIPNLDRTKAAAALAFHREIREAVERNQGDDAYRQNRYELRAVVGTEQPTLQSARTTRDGVEVERAYEGRDLGGDGTVPRVSATPIEVEREAGAMYSNARHASLQNADPVLLQLRQVLAAARDEQATFRAAAGAALALDVADTLLESEPVRLDVRPGAPPGGPMRVSLERLEDGDEVAAAPLRKRAGSDAFTAELAPPAPGAYRIRVDGGQGLEPVSDLLTVLPAVPPV